MKAAPYLDLKDSQKSISLFLIIFWLDSSQVFGLSSHCFSLGVNHKLMSKRYQQRHALAEMDSGLQQQDAPEGDARTRWSSGHNDC